MQFNDGPTKTFLADEAISKYMRVSITSTGVKIADLTDRGDGTALEDAASGADVSVRLRNAAGTHIGIASEAIEVGDVIYSENAGKLQDTAQATGYPEGIAITAAGADDDLFEFIYRSDEVAET